MTCCMAGLWACVTCPFNCMKVCCASLCKCAKQCMGACCAPCMGLCACLKNCIVSCCTPCMKLCAPCIKCAKCLNCCNIECGLPCRKPPGCVCIFPCEACGVGLTLPYCCFSCGCDHCIKMPKEERQYWWNSKMAAPTMQDMKKTSKAEKIQALEAEIERLKKAESDFDAAALA